MYSFHYIISGAHDKPKILFLHGFMGSIDDWHAQQESLSSHYRCMFVDLPGHGATEIRDKSGYDFVNCAEGIVKFLKDQHFYPVNLVGYSLGGRISLYIAVFWADIVQRLVLESASPGIALEKDRLNRIRQDELLAEQIRREWPGFVDSWYRQPIFQGIDSGLRYSDMIRQKKSNDPENLAYVLQGMGQGIQPQMWDKLESLQKPVLLLSGEQDTKYLQISERMERKLKRCTRSVIPDCSHNIHFQNPDRFNKEIRKFITGD